VGGGNNGGDALVVLRTLAAWGRDVAAVYVGGREPDAALLHGWDVPRIAGGEMRDAFAGAAVLVDGLLGTGAAGAPREAEAAAIEAMNASGVPIVALDDPSGVDMTTGATPGAAVRAAATVTFGPPKRGLLLFPGRAHAGRVVAVEIGLEPREADAFGAALLTPGWARAHLPRMDANVHKGQMGLVAVLAGHAGMAGAAVLAGWGAMRAGAGKVRMLSPDANRIVIQTMLPEALFADRDGDALADAVSPADALVAGPGMGTADADEAILRRVLEATDAPALLDADAVTLLARDASLRDAVRGPLVLTPHPGEAARLLGVETRDVTADPFAAAAEAASRYRCTVLLKGSPSVVAEEGRPSLVNVAGHAGIATGGMGDVLSGVAGAILAAGAAPRDAAGFSLYLAGRAAEIAGRGRGLLPRDVAEALPAALAELHAGDATPPFPGVLLDLPAAY
jgi:hydroxyethylthiazole kinase-like uncharacterized protein yjeF